MTDITFRDDVKVELIKSNATDTDVAYAAWVSNFADRKMNTKEPEKETVWNHETRRWEDSEERKEWDKKIEGLINFLYRNQHMSPFEHGSFTFMIECPLFVRSEFQRHRTFSYNEMSGRYTEMLPDFYLPNSERPLVQTGKVGNYEFVPGTPEQHGVMLAYQQNSVKVAWDSYQKVLEAGVAREVARNILPLNTYTKFYATANPRNVLQFLMLRDDKHALAEIRWVAEIMAVEFEKQMPKTYAAYFKNRQVTDVIRELVNTHGPEKVLEILMGLDITRN